MADKKSKSNNEAEEYIRLGAIALAWHAILTNPEAHNLIAANKNFAVKSLEKAKELGTEFGKYLIAEGVRMDGLKNI